MHTILVLAGGFALLGVCLGAGKFAGGSGGAMRRAALVFLPLWLAGAGFNLWYGVTMAGYGVGEEMPIFFIVFTVPAAAALMAWWKFKTR